MIKLNAVELLIGLWFLAFVAVHILLKHVLLKRIREMHPNIWNRMGRPKVLSFKESHWALIGITADFPICKSLGTGEIEQITRSQIYRYRVFSGIEMVLLASMITAIIISD